MVQYRVSLEMIMRGVQAFLKDESGATAIEYVMVASLISIVIVVSLSAIGSSISTNFLGPISTGLG